RPTDPGRGVLDRAGRQDRPGRGRTDVPVLHRRPPIGMSLSAEEFRTHLELSAAVAGVALSEIVLPTAHHVLLGAMRFHYLDWGEKGLPPVVFLHGGGLNAHTWDLVCASLRGERHCLALDQRGHGES